MKTYRVTLYSIISQEFDIEATSPEDAKIKILEGEGEPVGDQFVEGPDESQFINGIGEIYCLDEIEPEDAE